VTRDERSLRCAARRRWRLVAGHPEGHVDVRDVDRGQHAVAEEPFLVRRAGLYRSRSSWSCRRETEYEPPTAAVPQPDETTRLKESDTTVAVVVVGAAIAAVGEHRRHVGCTCPDHGAGQSHDADGLATRLRRPLPIHRSPLRPSAHPAGRERE
jgi:hypothetical protein